MRAKDYLRSRKKTMVYYVEIQQIINDLYDLRHDKEATEAYYGRILIADIRDDEYKDWKELHQKYGALAIEPQYNNHECEINKGAILGVRSELLNVIRFDKTFGYIACLLKREKISQVKQSEVEDALRQELMEKLCTAQKQISKLDKQLIAANRNIEILKQNSNRLDVSKNRGSMNLVTCVLFEILKRLSVLKEKNVFNTKLANCTPPIIVMERAQS